MAEVMRIQAASEAQIEELMSWFPDSPALKRWGGPAFRYPFTRESFLQDLRWNQMPAFALVTSTGEMAGFGQFYEKDGRGHLARLVVSDGHRGQGHGKTLIRLLSQRAQEQIRCSEISLYVMKNNEAAIYCYQAVGFRKTPFPSCDAYNPDIDFMVWKPTRIAV